MENRALRVARAVPDQVTGVLVTFVDPMSPCVGQVQVHDVLCAVDGVIIANDATIPWRKRERLDFLDLIQRKVSAVVLRWFSFAF